MLVRTYGAHQTIRALTGKGIYARGSNEASAMQGAEDMWGGLRGQTGDGQAMESSSTRALSLFSGKGAPGVHREPTPGSVQEGGPQQEPSSQDGCLAEMQCCTMEEAGKKH